MRRVPKDQAEVGAAALALAAAVRGVASNGCCTTCNGTGASRDPETNGRCWDCRGTGHPHDGPCDPSDADHLAADQAVSELTIGERAECKHCGETLVVADGGVMGHYWYHVATDRSACYPVQGVWTKPQAAPVEHQPGDRCSKLYPEVGHEDEGYTCTTHNMPWDECPHRSGDPS